MAAHERFKFKSALELAAKIEELKVDIALQEDLSPLAKPVRVRGAQAPNAIAALPMEGCDALPDGGPSELLERRYHRISTGGAGLIWWEACAVVEEGKANPRQMMLTEANQADYARLVGECRVSGALQILQLTHSGRYSRPSGKPAPIVPQRDPLLDPRVGITGDWEIASDAYLESLIEKYAKSAKLAEEAGFDGVDIKACHRYLLSELLASHERTGKYGGSLENRARLLLEIAKAVRASTGSGFIVACRFNVFDNHPYPYGFGMGKDGTFDSSEPIKLTRMLCDSGFDLLAVSAGNPYYLHPQTGRPFDSPPEGIPVPNEHPLESASRLFSLAQLVAKEAGNVPVIGCGYSWLRQYLPLVGSANLERGGCSFVGLGRSSLAYPDAPKDILEGRGMSPEKCCIACSKCTQLMRDHERAGCVARDSRVYGPIYKQGREAATSGKST